MRAAISYFTMKLSFQNFKVCWKTFPLENIVYVAALCKIEWKICKPESFPLTYNIFEY